MHPLQLPSVKTVGEGRAIIMHGGKMLDAKWKRGSNLDPVSYTHLTLPTNGTV